MYEYQSIKDTPALKGSGSMLPWENFAIMGLKGALFMQFKPALGGKYNAQGINCRPSAIFGGGQSTTSDPIPSNMSVL